mmetsp:Transcript_3040/g.14354  ORF Transcript_3040/g.14354 Transcript_3040/m.14354 type:complete len:257 (+) Transcript_3040:1647-2417(+)
MARASRLSPSVKAHTSWSPHEEHFQDIRVKAHTSLSPRKEDFEDVDGLHEDGVQDDAVLTGDYDVETYIKGLLWNMQMYIDGYPPDQLFYYRFKYAPPVDAVLDFFLEKGMYTQVDLPVSNRPAITSQLALTLMLPSAAWSLAPGRLQPLVKSGASISDFVEVRKRVQEIPFSTYTGEERTMLRTGVVWRYRKGSEPEPFTRPPPPMHWECCKALPPGKTNRNPFEVINSPSLRTYSDAREEKTVKLAFGDRLVRF